MDKEKILNNETYLKIVNFIHEFSGLAIDCEIDLLKIFSQIHPHTVSSILFTEWNDLTKAKYGDYLKEVPNWITKFESENSSTCYNPHALLNIAKKNKVPPSLLSRLIINKKYGNTHDVTEVLRQPTILADDEHYAANIRICTLSDNQGGPIVDIRRRCLGEEYEYKLKTQAAQSGLIFYDEANLRRTGFDKTPDLKLVLPCFYKGCAVNWIESKALFGDLKTHRRYLNEQLQSYYNRFGPGIVIYWFGFLEYIKSLKENGDGLIILDDFPQKIFLQYCNI